MTPSVKAIQAHCSIGWKESVKTRSPTWIVATTSQTVPGRAERQEPVVSAVRSRGRAGRPRRDVPSRGPLSRLCSDPQRCGVSIAGHCGRSRGRLCRGYVLSAGDYKPRDAEHAVLYRVIDEDRKSTRLNSSHTVISYAVFCLKKKKKNINRES